MSSAVEFFAFLKSREVANVKDASMLSFGGIPKPGKWYIKPSDTELFFELFSKLKPYNYAYHFVEQWPKNAMYKQVVFDFDLEPSSVPLVKFDAAGRAKFLEIINRILGDKIPSPIKDIAVKCQAPDSYHVIVVGFAATFNAQKKIAKALAKEYGLLEKEVDQSIYTQQRGLRLLYCVKTGEEEKKRMSKFLDENGEWKEPTPEEIFDQLKTCSIMSTSASHFCIGNVEPDSPMVTSPPLQAEFSQEVEMAEEGEPSVTDEVTEPNKEEEEEKEPEDEGLRDFVLQLLKAKAGIIAEDVKSIKKEGVDSYKVTLYTKWCMIKNDDHKKNNGRAVIINPTKIFYTCLNSKCEKKKNKKVWSWTGNNKQLDTFFPDRKKAKKRKEKEELLDDDGEPIVVKKTKKKKDSALVDLLQDLSKHFEAMEYRRIGEFYWEPIKVESLDGELLHTGAYKQAGHCRELITKHFVSTHPLWSEFIHSRSLDAIIGVYSNMHDTDPLFPSISPDMLFRSYRDFQWDMTRREFIPHTIVPHEITSIFYHDFEIGPYLEMDPQSIELKCFDYIFKHQEWADDWIQTMYECTGRLFAPARQFDELQFCYFLYGPPGCGKSTYFEAIKNCFWFDDVGTLNAASNNSFFLQGMETKKVVICPEVDHSFKLDRTIFNSMISATDPVIINRKNTNALNLSTWRFFPNVLR